MNKTFIVLVGALTIVLIVILAILILFGQKKIGETEPISNVIAPTQTPVDIAIRQRLDHTLPSSSSVPSLSKSDLAVIDETRAKLPITDDDLSVEYSSLLESFFIQNKATDEAALKKFIDDNRLGNLYKKRPDLFRISKRNPLEDLENEEQKLLQSDGEVDYDLDAQGNKKATQPVIDLFQTLLTFPEGSDTADSNLQIDTTQPTPATSITPRGQLPKGPVPASETVRVQGIRVHRSIANQLDAMINAARAAGIRLGGGGWRSNAQQIAMREARCPGRVYDSSCRGNPPAAVPGKSRHEWGVAIDVTCDGRLIPQHAKLGQNKCFDWLVANAGRYGFYEWGKGLSRNKPAFEAWHWSVDGH